MTEKCSSSGSKVKKSQRVTAALALGVLGLFWWLGHLTGFWWWGVPVLVLGTGLNLFVVWRNGGLMPVLTNERVCDMGPAHTVIYAYTRHRWLCDIYNIPVDPTWKNGTLAFRHRGMASLGDFLIWGGFAVMNAQLFYTGIVSLYAMIPW